MRPFGYSLREILLHFLLLVLTLVTTSMAGVLWLNQNPYELENFSHGLLYGVLVILILGSHELGHLIAARANLIDSTLPYFLPFPSLLGVFPFGTLGAVIKLRSPLHSKNSLIDVGASGPIVGFLTSTIVLAIGFLLLPSKDYLISIHPEYANLEAVPANGLTFGPSGWYLLIQAVCSHPQSFIPPMNEIYHYPFLCAGWLGLFVTTMNLVPVGQLDGGHILQACFGEKARSISLVVWIGLLTLGGIGLWQSVAGKAAYSWSGWLLWAIILLFFTRGFRAQPNAFPLDEALSFGRKCEAVMCALIFVATFSPNPISFR
jgi:membrane-associated protease RseP (regulator of RpoE activity)